MPRSRPQNDDIFARRPLADLKARLERADLDAEAQVAGVRPFMEATVAAAMTIAYADGRADLSERNRLLALFRANTTLQGFSVGDVTAEMEEYRLVLAQDLDAALAHARGRIVSADLTNAQFRTLLSICVAVLEADGVRHPEEESALAMIAALRPWGYR